MIAAAAMSVQGAPGPSSCLPRSPLQRVVPQRLVGPSFSLPALHSTAASSSPAASRHLLQSPHAFPTAARYSTAAVSFHRSSL
ncbi:hypothetical protein GDO78_021381 [Eleutherodactylus coqui]|uniref:Uncharacterized protein n=1 Tax=Eleutherodactylus coqui TaxID=57060 RepID=A0A8J6JXP4_ELECQ|nr:hypothetical protein GDO78_021381 [Eleutherodactylus coqui]